ncbi:MAG: hypothetical protein K2W86_04235 [Sphingomonas sp.]|uniref:hypothetical protein n=1 Tax=Sphingomonas sp. TaxID=28214 RepID=UPI0035A93F64|nr:hypothetical protein [Sphingomonas sp.]
MMIKALAALTLILLAVDYALTGGSYSAATMSSIGHLGHWLADSARNSIFSR